MTDGLPSTKQMTFTTAKNETSPAWAPDGARSSSCRIARRRRAAATQNQLYLMRPDGGEARRVTDAKDGVVDFALSPDGKTIVYRAGRERRRASCIASPSPSVDGAGDRQGRSLTKQPAGVDTWEWAPDSRARLLLVARQVRRGREGAARQALHRQHPQRRDADVEPLGARLWSHESKAATRSAKPAPTRSSSFSVSDDGKWIGFRGGSTKRYERNITQEGCTRISTCSRPRAGRSSG